MTNSSMLSEATVSVAGLPRSGLRRGIRQRCTAGPWRAVLRRILVAVLLPLAQAGAYAGVPQRPATLPTPQECGPLTNAFGPFDYRDPRNFDSLNNVNSNHFNSDVEAGIKGQTGSLGGDLSYTLRAFPNHHRALVTLVRLAARNRTEEMQGLGRTVTCWLVRAAEFAPDDPVVHSIFAVHLKRLDMLTEAIRHVDQALALKPDDPNMLYNAGLLYFDAKNYDKAADYATKAYKAGFALPGLRQKLELVGRWRE